MNYTYCTSVQVSILLYYTTTFSVLLFRLLVFLPDIAIVSPPVHVYILVTHLTYTTLSQPHRFHSSIKTTNEQYIAQSKESEFASILFHLAATTSPLYLSAFNRYFEITFNGRIITSCHIGFFAP